LIPSIFILRFGKTKSSRWLRFFYSNYTNEYWWYEYIWIIRKLTIAFALISPFHYLQRIILSALFTIFLTLQYWMQPFKNPRDNLVDIIGIFLIVFTYLNLDPNTSIFLIVLNLLFLVLIPFIVLPIPYSSILGKMKYFIRCCKLSK